MSERRKFHDSPYPGLLFERGQAERWLLHRWKGSILRFRACFTKSDKIFYTTLSVAVASTAEIALRDAIAAGEVQTLQEAVQELRCIRDEIIAAIGGKEVEQNG